MNFWPIIKRELSSHFVLPTLYIVMVIFTGLAGYFFFTDLTLFNWLNFKGTNSLAEGLWQYYFNDIRFVMIFVMPLLTMRLLSEEKKTGTIELLYTYPVKDVDILIGKFIPCVVVLILMLALSLLNIIALGTIWNFSGTILSIGSGYLGLFLIGCSLIACGIFISSLTKNQVVAAIGTLGVFVFFWFLTWNEMIASEVTIDVLRRLSLFDRVMDFFKGVIDTKDVVFFVLFTSFFLILTLLSLKSRSWRGVR